jgi:hypothetical protein
MNCSDIPAFLRENGSKKSRCERLAARLTGCDCEAKSVQPDVSPGIIEVGEVLVRYLAADHVDTDDCTVKTSAFSHAGQSGMSVDRLGYRTAEREDEVKTGHVGSIQAISDDVRAISHDMGQCFAIYDTALPANRAHADVCQRKYFPRSREAEFRRRLREKFLLTNPIWFEGRAPTSDGTIMTGSD